MLHYDQYHMNNPDRSVGRSPSRLLKTLIRSGIAIIIMFATSGSQTARSSGVPGGEGNTGSTSSLDSFCQDGNKPFGYIVYSYSGNRVDCSATPVPPPLQVMDGQPCPPGTTKQQIYQYEGTEAVCLP